MSSIRNGLKFSVFVFHGVQRFSGHGMRRVSGPKRTIADEAFLRLEAHGKDMSAGILNVPDVDDDDDDFEPKYAPPSSSKPRPTSASNLRPDRTSMGVKSSAGKKSRLSKGASGARTKSSLKRRLDFFEHDLSRDGNTSELAETDEEDCEMDVSLPVLAANKKRRGGGGGPRLSMASMVTPVAKSAKRKQLRVIDSDDDSAGDDIPLPLLHKKSPKAPGSKSPATKSPPVKSTKNSSSSKSPVTKSPPAKSMKKASSSISPATKLPPTKSMKASSKSLAQKSTSAKSARASKSPAKKLCPAKSAKASSSRNPVWKSLSKNRTQLQVSDSDDDFADPDDASPLASLRRRLAKGSESRSPASKVPPPSRRMQTYDSSDDSDDDRDLASASAGNQSPVATRKRTSKRQLKKSPPSTRKRLKLDISDDDSDFENTPSSTRKKTGNTSRLKTSVRKSPVKSNPNFSTPTKNRSSRPGSSRLFRQDNTAAVPLMVDLTSPERASEGVVEIKSSRYPLPVMTQSPLPRRLRRRRVVGSDDDDDDSDNDVEGSDDSNHGNLSAANRSDRSKLAGKMLSRNPGPGRTDVNEPPPRPMPFQPSAAVAAKENPHPVEWFQERSIDEFTDSGDDVQETTIPNLGASSVRPVPAIIGRSRAVPALAPPRAVPSLVTRPASPRPGPSRPASRPSSGSGRNNTQTLMGSFMKTSAPAGKKSTTLVKAPPRASNRRMQNGEQGMEKFKKDLIVIESDSDDDFEPSKVPSKESIDLDEDDDEGRDLSRYVPEKTSDEGSNSNSPPAFRLEVLCIAGESVMQMMQRLGEDLVMERIIKAQNEGRTIIGGEALGISCAPPPTTAASQAHIERMRNAVNKPGKRKNSYDAAKALAGDFSFGYRGKGKTYPTGGRGNGKRRGSWRGRGRGKGRGRR